MIDIETQAQNVLDALLHMPFAICIPISRDFSGLTSKPGIYAVRHRQDGLLYVGKAMGDKLRLLTSSQEGQNTVLEKRLCFGQRHDPSILSQR